ncbi:YdcF family protein [Candidatus Uhrbacteria bacterium]|nr:YdcF family protein [Candidatus Uhrbacteria bacterium]
MSGKSAIGIAASVILASVGLTATFFCLGLPVILVGQAGRWIHADIRSVSPENVAIVFGAGITPDNRPSDVLNDRLKVAAELYRTGKVSRILVSGDNRREDYSEPDVMFRALISGYGVPAEDVHVDYAGRRTYDTCIRAHDLWGIDRAILVSQDFHLPRAIWTCRKLGVESVGASASLRTYERGDRFRYREIFADYKAFVDIYVWRPDYVSGDYVMDLD